MWFGDRDLSFQYDGIVMEFNYQLPTTIISSTTTFYNALTTAYSRYTPTCDKALSTYLLISFNSSTSA